MGWALALAASLVLYIGVRAIGRAAGIDPSFDEALVIILACTLSVAPVWGMVIWKFLP